MAHVEKLAALSPGMKLLVGGDRLITVTEELAAAFQPGDQLHVVHKTGELMRVPCAIHELVTSTLDRAERAFARMGTVSDAQITQFFLAFAERLADDAVWRQVMQINEKDVKRAQERGRSTTRLVATAEMRSNMVDGLKGWATAPSVRGKLIDRVEHDGWAVELVGAELGIVGFVFEGRPNVVADATGVLRSGNTVVFRIGQDALDTARAIVELGARPALVQAGLPEHAVCLIDCAERAAGWALFSDSRLSLAVARGSGPAVAALGGLAQQTGIPVSLHGTGGAWLIAGTSAATEQIEQVVYESLDRKVCNTLNTVCLPASRAGEFVPALLRGLERAAKRRGHGYKLHVTRPHRTHVPQALFDQELEVLRATGSKVEKQAELLEPSQLGLEWEWEATPEISLTFVDEISEAVGLFNRLSPNFVASLLSAAAEEHELFYETINAPFVGDGMTRWVDGQFALNKPELGLSNWQHGRLFGRAGILSGDSVFTVRTRRRTC